MGLSFRGVWFQQKEMLVVTSILMVALTGLPGGVMSTAPKWHTDYAIAQKEAESAKKPLAVFLAPGGAGYDKVARDGGMNSEVRRTLATEYVCVHINSAEANGKRLAAEFEMPSGLGIIISDRTGTVQAFRHEGDLGNRDLGRYLVKYADPNRVPIRTESNPGDERPVIRSTYFQNCST
jgi:hypothetical protein